MTRATCEAEMTATATPVTILGGFLGAGKTTLLKRILSDPQGVRFGVLVNDFGAIDIDGELVVEASGEQISLANGCVCCTIRDDLVTALRTLLDREPAPERIVIETSGVSRPLSVADAVLSPELSDRAVLDGLFCLVDVAGFKDLDFAATELALDQTSGADLVILNKADLATPDEIAAVAATLRGPMPRVRTLETSFAELPHAVLFGVDPLTAARPSPSRSGHGHHHAGHDHNHHQSGHDHEAAPHDHGQEFEAWSWRTERPVDLDRLRAAVPKLPPSLLRAKGILRTEDAGEGRTVFQLVGKRSSFEREAVPAPWESAIVAIGRRGTFDPARLTEILDSCRGDG